MRRFLGLCVAIVLGACHTLDAPDQNITLPTTDTNVSGTFILTSANGNVPPYTAGATSSELLTLVNDRIVIHDDQTWADTTNYSVQRRSDGVAHDSSTATSGTYAIANGHINFTMTHGGGAVFVGSVIGDELAVNFSGALFRYQR